MCIRDRRDVLDGVREGMREVVHRVDAPAVARAMMARVPDTIEHGVTHVQIRRGHVDLGAHYVRAVRELAGTHARKEVEALGHRSIAEGAVAPRLGERAAMAAN